MTRRRPVRVFLLWRHQVTEFVGQRTAGDAWEVLRHHIDRVFTPDEPSTS
ncbi:hypothetical protein [Streptomyces sp. RPT161]|nr:hypothetical protein [Streptomyces sp. RPT161]